MLIISAIMSMLAATIQNGSESRLYGGQPVVNDGSLKTQPPIFFSGSRGTGLVFSPAQNLLYMGSNIYKLVDCSTLKYRCFSSQVISLRVPRRCADRDNSFRATDEQIIVGEITNRHNKIGENGERPDIRLIVLKDYPSWALSLPSGEYVNNLWSWPTVSMDKIPRSEMLKILLDRARVAGPEVFQAIGPAKLWPCEY